MSSPARTKFCSKGHVVECIGHGEEIENELNKCPICGDENILTQFEWGDEDEIQLVPTEPVRKDYTEHTDDFGNIYFLPYNIYDVSKLLERDNSIENE